MTNGNAKVVSGDLESHQVKTISELSLEKAKAIFSEMDYLVMYTWFGATLLEWVEKAVEAGTSVIIKCDHIGRFGTKKNLVNPIEAYNWRKYCPWVFQLEC